MRTLEFDKDAFKDFLSWQKNDKKVFTKIVHLLDACRSNPTEGIGKPEALKY